MSEDKQFIRRDKGTKKTSTSLKEVDIYRDTFIRYMGECSSQAESAQIHRNI